MYLLQVKGVPAVKGVVRGKMGCSGWVVAPAEGGSASRVTYVSVTDLKVQCPHVPAMLLCCLRGMLSNCARLCMQVLRPFAHVKTDVWLHEAS